MKKKILLFTMIGGLCYFALSSYNAGPATAPNNFELTGADAASGSGNGTGCSLSGAACHNTSATAGITVVLDLDSAGVVSSSTTSGTGHYKPGHTYTIKLIGTNTTSSNLPKFGFQVAATKGSTAATSPVNAGTLQSTGLPAGVHYVAAPGTSATFYANVVEHHIPLSPASGSGATGTVYTDSFTWTAPAAGTGTVSIWAALNAVNFNTGADPGDLWNTAHLVLNEIPTTSVRNVLADMNIKAFPNPVNDNLHLQFENAQPGTYAVQVFDLTGRTVYSQVIDVNSISQTSISTANWPAGIYQLAVEKDGDRKVISVVK